MALYGTYESEKVGPVRSIRTFFVDWAHGFLAYLAHVGGNIDALDQIAAEKSLDLDQFKYSAPYWRERSTGLASEHTMYTSTLKLRDQATTNKYSAANNFNIYRFKEEPTEEEKLGFVEKQDVTINFSNNAKYEVVFKYDKATNSYKRYLAGVADIDNLTKTQITAKNIIVMSVKRKAVTTRINESGWEMTTVGTGTAKIYLDGKAINGTWRKDSKEARELFFDENGAEIVFNRGQFWICVVPPEVTPNVTN
jgi:hypothetical protein